MTNPTKTRRWFTGHAAEAGGHCLCLQEVLVDLIETVQAHVRVKSQFIKQHFGVVKTRLCGMAINHRKPNMLAALTNLFLARQGLLTEIRL